MVRLAYMVKAFVVVTRKAAEAKQGRKALLVVREAKSQTGVSVLFDNDEITNGSVVSLYTGRRQSGAIMSGVGY